MYGTFQEVDIWLPQPNYSKAKEQICWEFTMAICAQMKSLNLLTLVSGLGPGLNAPSWVPDFDEIQSWGFSWRHEG
jgi:hypothetical protein